jgi:hypothetical protein
LNELVAPAARGRLLARGLARGLLWRDGVLPLGAPNFAPTLTHGLLDFGYGVLALALELRDANRTREPGTAFPTSDAFRVAAEAIESAVRREQQLDRDEVIAAWLSDKEDAFDADDAMILAATNAYMHAVGRARLDIALRNIAERHTMRLRWASLRRSSFGGRGFRPPPSPIASAVKIYFLDFSKLP